MIINTKIKIESTQQLAQLAPPLIMCKDTLSIHPLHHLSCLLPQQQQQDQG